MTETEKPKCACDEHGTVQGICVRNGCQLPPLRPTAPGEAVVFTASAGTCRRCKSRVRMGGPAPDSCTNCAAPAEPQPPCTVPDETREALEEAMRDRIIEKAGLDANDCDVDSADPADHVVGGIDAMRRSLDTSLGLAMDDVARLVAHPPRAGEVTEAARDEFFGYVSAELDRAYAKHGREPWGRHEFFAILKEEVDELWDDIKADAPDDPMYKEMVQVAAMCFRFFETGGCRYRRAALGRPS